MKQVNGSNPFSSLKWYAGLAAGIGKVRLSSKPVPLMAHWEITYRCNLDCSFCTTRWSPRSWNPETTPAEAIRIVDQLAGMGTKVLNIVGGEPTVRNDFPDIVRHAKSKGIRVAVTTNGVMRETRREWLVEADVIRVSLEGAPALNSFLRRAPDKIDVTSEAIETLRYLTKRGRRPLIGAIHGAKTTDEDIEFLATLCREMGIQIKMKPMSPPRFGDMTNGFTPHDYEMRTRSAADTTLPLQESLRKIAQYQRLYPDCFASGEPDMSILGLGGLDTFGCLAMTTSICIKPDGSVALPCTEFPKDVAKSSDLASIFYGKLADEARKNQGRYWFCKGCDLSCMIHATSLVRFKPLLGIVRNYWPQLSFGGAGGKQLEEPASQKVS